MKRAHSFFGAWSFLLVHIRFTPSEGPHSFVKCFFPPKSNHGNWTEKKYHLPRSDFMVHGVNYPWTFPLTCEMIPCVIEFTLGAPGTPTTTTNGGESQVQCPKRRDNGWACYCHKTFGYIPPLRASSVALGKAHSKRKPIFWLT
jgi:hypothetical protein